ncbi:beta-ig-h3 fasciclin [Chrysochromulina tobinii]|jgi:uncharacterized surface protein with fasciclin (FAS1) repeats|uniref:Beta-ig-h3 fasciclin n=1 Tax=Chrysochromulina tobinii TaxID=1460289 RepID=A0A0M0JIX7_9EUKA|nr:beta-ig-h3 fasciclin [Chrysochromulina tobinii]|eukprot:KOO26524.1 beta-ig-h3 fasciclin [Chrysochromulina sp. CCMP291]
MRAVLTLKIMLGTGAAAFRAPITLPPTSASSHATRSGTVNAVSSWYDEGKRLSSSVKAEKKADIADTVGSGAFKTLAAALGAAGLADTIKTAGPFTVFAPTDEAFAKLPAGTVDNLLKPENKAKLASILTYHVLSGKVMASTVVTMDGKKVTTVNGAEITIKVGKDGVMVNSANVTKTDVECSNGVIHIIDAVMLPAPEPEKLSPEPEKLSPVALLRKEQAQEDEWKASRPAGLVLQQNIARGIFGVLVVAAGYFLVPALSANGPMGVPRTVQEFAATADDPDGRQSRDVDDPLFQQVPRAKDDISLDERPISAKRFRTGYEGRKDVGTFRPLFPTAKEVDFESAPHGEWGV